MKRGCVSSILPIMNILRVKPEARRIDLFTSNHWNTVRPSQLQEVVITSPPQDLSIGTNLSRLSGDTTLSLSFRWCKKTCSCTRRLVSLVLYCHRLLLLLTCWTYRSRSGQGTVEHCVSPSLTNVALFHAYMYSKGLVLAFVLLASHPPCTSLAKKPAMTITIRA